MTDYVLQLHPLFEKTYFDNYQTVAKAELSALDLLFEATRCEFKFIGNAEYLCFSTHEPLSAVCLSRLFWCTCVFTVFEVYKDCLKPIALKGDYFIPPKVSSLLKYSGKTNEIFTRLMLNTAINYYDRPVKTVMDPVCGRGTTLFEAAVRGISSIGMDIKGDAIHEASVFLKKFLERERFKHVRKKRTIKNDRLNQRIPVVDFEFAEDKSSLKGENCVRVALQEGELVSIAEITKKESIDIIIGDLPYGVAHANKASKSKHRSPEIMINDALPYWRRTLKAGGIVALSWNTFVCGRKKMESIFVDLGFDILKSDVSFVHKVDSSIVRDILFAQKTV